MRLRLPQPSGAAIRLAMICFCGLFTFEAAAQSPSVLYTWEGTADERDWVKNFGTNTVTIDNSTSGELRITENGAAGLNIAVSDSYNRVRESAAASGGLDLTGLEFLEFDMGHNGSGPINVQFFVQTTPDSTYLALGGDIAVIPGISTYQLALDALLPEQAVYVRTMGFNARDHIGEGNVVWTISEVRAVGEPLEMRQLITHDDVTIEGGLQGAMVNFDNTAVLGNTGPNTQTGLSHNPAGSGSLQWTDLGGMAGAAISWGNGTPLNGNTFFNRTADLSNYTTMIIRMSAAEITPELGGALDVQAFFQTNDFIFQVVDNGFPQSLPLDGQFHDLAFSLEGLMDMNVVDQTGINLAAHATDLRINVDAITFIIPEPGSLFLIGVVFGGCCFGRRFPREVRSMT